MSEALQSIYSSLDTLAEAFPPRFESAKDEQTLREENAKILGKKGELTSILKQLGQVPADSRKAVGERVNQLKTTVESAFEARLLAFRNAKRAAELNAPPFDLTLPARPQAPLGHRHPLSIVRDEIVDVFRGLGFAIHDGPEVELEENNFTRLGFPPDHPATDMQDTFYTTKGRVLRTHTSNIQVRAMMGHKPPMAFVAPGAVYRRDDDVTHSPMFHQIEAFLIDENVSMAELKGVVTEFLSRLYGAGIGVRFRPSYFPFVEPGCEIDVQCVFCRQPDGTNKGCNLCKGTGFIEIMGAGMIHPTVFESCGIDPKKYTGFALGLGIERVAILRYGIPDIRLFYENDPRFLAQF